MAVNFEKLGNRVKFARENKGLSQEKLAELTGLSNNYISNIERNSSKPSIETLVHIANSLDVSIDYFLLDSVYKSSEYIKNSIAELLKKCDVKDMLLIENLIKAVIGSKK